MNRINALETVLRGLRENACEVDRQAIDAVLAIPVSTQIVPISTPAHYGWLMDNMVLVRSDDRAEHLQQAGQVLMKLYDGEALAAAQGNAAEREGLITYLHGRMVAYKNLYESTLLATQFNTCNCGHTGDLERERCGKDGNAFAVRCPACNKSVQAFTEAGLPASWNAVNRKHAPVPFTDEAGPGTGQFATEQICSPGMKQAAGGSDGSAK
ncbi:hypothetical protein H8F21_14020 [Pseudomonas sp. P66]|uniref:Uncharacterized protein n=1 Tax=Pseudomonas arcuscaelestis TaxID=2710591 RepID=A0ABS2BYI0_9PSED|nr:hypothetical protein [Pseudomonas arcuscaelestis]MBM5458681.1 hypothetical protein [Pseudomonas arcuscaelestis]